MAVIVITGTSSGIGLATVLHFARKGHQVFATMRNLDRAGALREAAAAEGLSPTILQLDVDDDASVRRAIGEVLTQVGRIDVLVNNAGTGALVPLEHTTEGETLATFNTNFFGALRTIRAVLPSMRAQRDGAIVNVSSIAGRVAVFCMTLYTASKHALEAASEALAQEVRSYGIRVAVIEPGFFDTPILDRAIASVSTDPASPYADAERRIGLIFRQGKAASGDPRVVAAAIEHAVTTPEPRLRYLVGLDAEVFAEGRQRMGDEAWVAMGRPRTDEDYFQEFLERFPLPVPAAG